MIKLLKSIGYNFVDKKTLNNREFRLSLQTYTVNEDYSTFDKQKYDLDEEYELFLDANIYSEKKMREILDATRGTELTGIVMAIAKQENGYLITFITTKIGV